MKKHLLSLLFATVSVPFLSSASAATLSVASDAPAQLLMQVASDLDCAQLGIEVISASDSTSNSLTFDKGAFAAVALPAGSYRFGKVTCTKGDEQESYDLFADKLAPIHLLAGQAYFGGKMIFRNVAQTEDKASAKALNSCARGISKQRVTAQQSECLNDAQNMHRNANSAQVQVYIPEVSDEELAKIRAALGVTKEQLLYLPLNS